MKTKKEIIEFLKDLAIGVQGKLKHDELRLEHEDSLFDYWQHTSQDLHNLIDRERQASETRGQLYEINYILEAIGEDEAEDEISIKWSIDDVKSLDEQRENHNITALTDGECRVVLGLAEKYHDATVGINWDILEACIDIVREKRI